MSTKTTDCGVQTYPNINTAEIKEMLSQLTENGAVVTGTNPWTITTNYHDIVLQAAWDESTSELSLSVLGKSIIVTCDEIWDYIKKIISGLSSEGAN